MTNGCEHFGLGLSKSPTSVANRWLISDPAKPGALQPFGADVSIAAPLWSVVPPAAPGAAPAVQAELPPPKAPPAQFGNAVWVKVLETESPDKVELRHLVTDDPAVPQQAGQVETEWALSQSNPRRPDRAPLHSGKPLGKGNQSVIRRYEFYKFAGSYDPLTHEAQCRGGGECKTPSAGEIGDYIGAQMAAAWVGQAAAPKITGVSNNASGDAGIASGSWVSIYGTDLAGTTRAWQNSDFAGNILPLGLDGVSVTINGKSAAVSYVSPGQLNVQAPTDSATGPVAVQLTNSSGAASGTATLQAYAPGFFTFSGKYVAAVHTDGVYVAPPALFGPDAASRPARPGEILLLYGTGFGPTTPAVAAGRIVSPAAPLSDPAQLHLRIGGVPASVQFAGIVAPGLYQFKAAGGGASARAAARIIDILDRLRSTR